MPDPAKVRTAVIEAFVKLDPRHMVRNPVMFVVEIGSVITTIQFLARAGVFRLWSSSTRFARERTGLANNAVR